MKIRRVRHTRFDKALFIGRLINMLSFQCAASWSALTARRAEVVVVETDPPFLCLLGRTLQFLRGNRLVCYLQDIYPDVAVALQKLRPGFIARCLRGVFFRVYRRSDVVVVLSEDMRDLIIAGGVRTDKVHIVRNWVDTNAVYPVKQQNQFRATHGLANRFVVMYNGNLGMTQGLSQLLEVAKLLRSREDIIFALVGDGADRKNLERLAASWELD